MQLAQRKELNRKMLHLFFISLCIVIISAVLIAVSSPYLGWDFSDPETVVFGATFHTFEWLFVRLAPVILVAIFIGIFVTRKKYKEILSGEDYIPWSRIVIVLPIGRYPIP